jgi:glycosyltransferase involved in cell wall biosynthesis
LDQLAAKEVFDISGGTPENFGIVVFSHLRWKFVWQRPQQLLSRIAANHKVLFVELTQFDLKEGCEPQLKLESVATNVTVANIHLASNLVGTSEVDRLMRKFCKFAIEAVNAHGEFDNPLLWYYSPMDAGWALGHINGRGIVYDCMDELSQFKGAPPEMLERERKLIAAADIIFTGGYELWLKKKRQHQNVHFFGCGVEFDHFNQAQERRKPIPQDMQGFSKPVVGWFGVVDERVDYDLVAELARIRPQYDFVLVGPVVKVDPASLPQANNIHWLGGRDYKVLPGYCRAFDVCMMCFALNEATEFINPTKALEYLATGKPIVSTPVKDVVRQYLDHVLIASTVEEFALQIDRSIQTPDSAMIARGLQKARLASWDSTVAEMRRLIAKSLGASQRVYLS